jgi:hypothetical protein
VRDKLIRYCLLTGNGDPYAWDFGSAARHHKLYAPWLRADQCRAGNTGMRGAIAPKVGRELGGQGDQRHSWTGGGGPYASRDRSG